MLPRLLLVLAFLLGADIPLVGALADTVWREQGPGPIYNGSNVAIQPGSPQAGAVSAIVPSPTDPAMLYVGTVNGGVWRSLDITVSNPQWTPLTDQSLPALSIASLTVSPANDKILFAGTGSVSALANVGSRGFGIARSVNAGATWSVIGAEILSRQAVTEIASVGSILLAGTHRPALSDVQDPDGAMIPSAAGSASAMPVTYGLYRSTNALNPDAAKVEFTRVSGTGKGLPAGGISAIAADPVHKWHFYASISARDGGQAGAGVYFSRDAGATWKRINGSAAKPLGGVGGSDRILLSVHADAKVVAVYAAVIGRDGTLTGVYRSSNQGSEWTPMGAPNLFPGQQGNIHGALLADPEDANVVWISGDRQALPNPSGCQSYYGAIMRGDATKTGNQRWRSVVCKFAQGTAPHADSRALAFDGRGNLIEADDGGIYQLSSVNGTAPKWTSLIGNIRPTELHSIAYDPLSKVILGGAQDNGVPIQSQPNSFAWSEFSGGDGGVVAVDADQAAHPGKSIRYTSYIRLQSFQRSVWDASNNLLGVYPVPLRIVAGSSCRKTLAECDRTAPFYTPMVLNRIDPSRMLIGTKSLYESANRGNSLVDLGNLGDTVGGASEFGRPMVYGGKFGGKAFPDMFYVGAGASLFHRVAAGAKLKRLTAYQGAEIRTVAVNPFNYKQVFVLDTANRVWSSIDEGAHFTSMTGNLHQLSTKIGTLAVYAPDAVASHAIVIAGGFGVFRANAGDATATWRPLARGFSHALVGDLQYDQASDTLVAGTIGRGAWTLTGFFTGKTSTAVAAAQQENQPAPKPFGNDKAALPAMPAQ